MFSFLQNLFYVYISIFILMRCCLFLLLYCSLAEQLLVHPFLCCCVFFSFLPLFLFLPFKQIKRFLLNMQAIVSSPSHDFTLSLFPTVLLVFVSTLDVCPSVRPSVRPCPPTDEESLTSVLAREAECVQRFVSSPSNTHFVVVSD